MMRDNRIMRTDRPGGNIRLFLCKMKKKKKEVENMKSKYRFRRILSGVMAAVTILSTFISPLTVYASEEPKAAEPPAYESVKDQLDEEEVVKATDLELEVGQDFDVSTDFTNLEIKDESKVKVTFQKAENDAGENFSTSHADTYHAVYYVEPVNQNHPVYQIGRNLIVKEPVTAAQSEPQTEQAVTEEDTGSDDEEAASQEETETVPVETEIVEPETAESETEEPEETEPEFQDGLSESEFDAALEESETENTTDEESGLTLSDVLEQAGEQDIDLMAMEDGETVSFTAVNTSTSAAVQMMEDMKDETAQILSVKKEKKKVQPPKLYDLTTLQREANRLLGFTAQQTLDYTQSLYEKKLVTYPRTDSQYLTDDMEENALLVVGAVNSMFPEMSIKGSEPDIKRLLNSKKVSDHHAIIPTVEITNMDLKALPGGEKEILMLIASKLLCASEQEYIYESIKTEISCHGELFTASGKNVLQYGWKEVEERFFKSYGKNAEKPEEEESDFPDIKIGQVFECVVVKFSEHFTAPPKHYTEDTLLSAMEHAGSSDTIEDAERKGLGTPATRAAIIEKLIEKGFIERKKKQILPTADGRNLIRILPEMIKSPKLTAEWENDLTLISRGQKNVEEFLFEIEKMVTKLVSDNGQPVEEYQKLFSDGRKEIGKCPRCDNKVYVGKRNYYCSGSDCSFTLWKNNRFFESQGKTLDEATVRKLLSEKQVHFKDLVSEKTKRKYEATIKMEVSETGNPKFQLIFPERKKGKKNEE